MIFKKIDPKSLSAIIQLLSEGKVVAVPTETVYGLAADGYHSQGVQKIYALKQRPLHNPLILHYHHVDQIKKDAIWTPWADQLAHYFWPGPLTMILEKKHSSPIAPEVTAGLSSVAVRISSHPFMAKLTQAYGNPLAAPSANPSGKLSPTWATHVLDFFSNKVPVVDAGPCCYGIESTIVDARRLPLHLLRPGALSAETLMETLKNTKDLDGLALSPWATTSPQGDKGICPGQLEAHYAPSKPIRLNAQNLFSHESLLAFGSVPFLPQESLDSSRVFQLSSCGNLEEAAHRLFQGLYHLDKGSYSKIAVMAIPKKGLGRAINDRLERAAAAFLHIN